MSTLALMIATAAACGLPMLWLHAQLTKERAKVRIVTDERDAYQRAAERHGADCYALRQALARARDGQPEPYTHRLVSGAPRAWGPS